MIRPFLAALLALCLGCAPHMVVPASGADLAYESCGALPSGPVVRHYRAPCPDLAALDERVRSASSRYPLCALDGIAIHVVDAYVECAGETRAGCTRGRFVTVTSGPTMLGTVSHEIAAHVCAPQVGDVFGEIDGDLRHLFRADDRELIRF